MNEFDDYYLLTAEEVNQNRLYYMWHDIDYEQNQEVECIVPNQQTAREYIEANRPFVGDPDGWPIYRHQYSSEQVKEYEKKMRRFQEMHLDMRDQIVTGADGKVGLQDVTGQLLIPPIFDAIPERYASMDEIRCYRNPVVMGGKHYLYDIRNKKVLTEGYDRIFRYFGGNLTFFVAQQDDKRGILDGWGELLVPIIMDEIYEMQDPDGCIPFVKDSKWGVADAFTYAPPIFERLEVWSEGYVKVWLDGIQGWVDKQGRFTADESQASIGSWYDIMK